MKQTVKYIDLGFCVVGCPARVVPLNHPHQFVKNREWATTSPVQSLTWTPNGPVFETLNTIYVPVDEDDEHIVLKTDEAAA